MLSANRIFAKNQLLDVIFAQHIDGHTIIFLNCHPAFQDNILPDTLKGAESNNLESKSATTVFEHR